MNFDINTLSTLMQLMGSQKPRESEANYNTSNDANMSYGNYSNAQRTSQSVFAMQNGLGQRIDLEAKQEKKPSSNPMSSIFEMMSGKGGNADMMSGFMPMLMNMMNSKPAQATQNSNNNSANQNSQSSFEQKLKEAKNNVDENFNRPQNVTKSTENKHSNAVESDLSRKNRKMTRDRYDPITFAGYSLISSLNKLYMQKKYERL